MSCPTIRLPSLSVHPHSARFAPRPATPHQTCGFAPKNEPVSASGIIPSNTTSIAQDPSFQLEDVRLLKEAYASTLEKLSSLKKEHASALTELASLKEVHASALTELASLKVVHASALTELASLKDDLTSSQKELETLRNNLYSKDHILQEAIRQYDSLMEVAKLYRAESEKWHNYYLYRNQ